MSPSRSAHREPRAPSARPSHGTRWSSSSLVTGSSEKRENSEITSGGQRGKWRSSPGKPRNSANRPAIGDGIGKVVLMMDKSSGNPGSRSGEEILELTEELYRQTMRS